MSSVKVHLDLAGRIRAQRMTMGLNQAQLADLTGITQSAISKYERGEQQPGTNNLIKLSDIFHVDFNWLLTGKDPEKKKNKPSGADKIMLPFVGAVRLSDGEKELLGKALKVIRAKKTEGAFDQALKSSIEALHAAVENAEGIGHKQQGSSRAKKAKRGTTKNAGT